MVYSRGGPDIETMRKAARRLVSIEQLAIQRSRRTKPVECGSSPLWVMNDILAQFRHVRCSSDRVQNNGHRRPRSTPTSEWSRAAQPCPASSDFDLLCDGEGIVHLNAQIPHGALDLRVAEQKLNNVATDWVLC